MNSQGRFCINAPSDPAISAVNCDPRKDPTFRRLFEREQLKAFADEVLTYADYCVLLTNASTLRITGFTVVWEHPHPALNGPPGNVSRSDSYYFGDNSRGIIPPHSQALLYPGRTMPAEVLEYDDLVFSSSIRELNGLQDIDMMRAAPRVAVTLDAVIFEDGRVLGDDESRTVEFIVNRKRAASDFVAQVRSAQQEGVVIEDVLRKLHTQPGNSRDDSYIFWLRTFVRQFSRVPAADRDVSLAQYAELPELPRFHNSGTRTK